MIGSLRRGRFISWVYLPSSGKDVGIVVGRDARVFKAEESLLGEFSVSVKIQKAGNPDWCPSGVDGANNTRVRKSFWDELAGLYGVCSPIWCVGGDFNVVRFPSEESGG